MAKYLFMYVSGGAGHVGRSMAIASYLRDIDPMADIVFAGGKVGEGLVMENGFDFVELDTPDYFMDGKPRADPGYLISTYLRNLRSYRHAMLSVSPDLVVVDTEPVFVFLSKFLGFRVVLINHEIKPLWVDELPPISRKVRDLILRKAMNAADNIIFPNIMDMELEGAIRRKSAVVGPLAYMEFERMEFGGDKKVLIVPSSTGNIPSELLKALKTEEYDVYIRGSGKDAGNVRFLKKTRNLLSYMAAVDLVICSGYSTIMEAVALGKPVVIYPKTEEQRRVGRMCERNGIALYSETPEGIWEAVGRIFQNDNLRASMVERQRRYGNGAMEAARFLHALVNGE